MRKAAFLDRDGVINIDHAYVYRREDFEFVEGVLGAARRLHEAGYALVVVTNQSGIGRGYYTEEDFEALNIYMCRRFEEAGAPIAGIYFCPHHPGKALGAYKTECTCRKPQPGMILRAAEELGLDLSASLLFGDKESDMQAALAAGIPRRILLGTDGAAEPAPTASCTAAFRSLEAAVDSLGL